MKIEPTVVIDPRAKIEIGDHSYIDDFVKIEGTVIIGKRVHVGEFCMLQGGGTITIGDYAGISPGCLVFSSSETPGDGKYMSGPRVLESMRAVVRKPVCIEKNAFVGIHSSILPGCTMKEGSILGANSLLLQDTTIPGWEIWAGSPAKKIGIRPRIPEDLVPSTTW